MPIFGQVWLWSSLAFLLGAVLCWLLVARPARSRVGELEAQLTTRARRQAVPERMPDVDRRRDDRAALVPGLGEDEDYRTRAYGLRDAPPPLPPERGRLAPYTEPDAGQGDYAAPEPLRDPETVLAGEPEHVLPHEPELVLPEQPRSAATQYLDVSSGSLTAPPEVPPMSPPPSDRGWFDDELEGDEANQGPEEQPAVPRNRHHLTEEPEPFDARLVDDGDDIGSTLGDDSRPADEDDDGGTVFTQRTHPIPGELIRQIDEAGKADLAESENLSDNLVDDLADDPADTEADRRERTVESEAVSPAGFTEPFTEPEPSFTEPEPSLGRFAEPESSLGRFAEPESSLGRFAEPEPSSGGFTEPEPSVAAFTEPENTELPAERTEIVAAVPLQESPVSLQESPAPVQEEEPSVEEEPVATRSASNLPKRVPKQNRIAQAVAVRVDPTPNALPKRVPGKPRHQVPFGVEPSSTPEPAAATAVADEPAEAARSLFEPIVPAEDEGITTPPPPHRLRQGSGSGRGPFGPGSAMPLPGGASPSPEFTIKASVAALRYCTPESPQFGRTVAEVWFRTAADAERVGFRPVG